MTIYTLRPSSDISTSSTDTDGAFGQPHYIKLNDNSDGTWVQFIFSGVATARDIYGLTDLPALGPLTQIVRVRVRIRYNTGFGTTDLYVTLQSASTGARAPSDYYTAMTSPLATMTGAWKTLAPDGTEWSPAKVNELVLDLWDQNRGTTLPRVTEAYVDVDVNALPVVSVTAPTGTISDTTTPTVVGTYSDPDGDPIDAYQVKMVFDGVGISGEGTPGIYDSGIVPATNTAISHKITTPLANGDYFAFVKVRQGGTIAQLWSIWYGSSFTIAVVPPNAPLLVATPDDAASRIQLRLTGQGPALVSGVRRFEVERSYDGAQWERLDRLWPRIPLSAYSYTTPNQVLDVFDYETKRGVPVRYRARVRSELVSGAVSVSAWTALATPVQLARRGWRLVPIWHPDQGIRLNNAAEEWRLETAEKVRAFGALGRRNPVFISDGMAGEEGLLEMAFPDQAPYDAFVRLRDLAEVTLLQSPYGDHLYIRLVGNRGVRFMLNPGGRTKRTVIHSWQEADVA